MKRLAETGQLNHVGKLPLHLHRRKVNNGQSTPLKLPWRRQKRAVNFHLHLDSEQVQHIPADDALSVGADTPVGDVMQRLKELGKGSILVLDENEKLSGIFTERDALRLMATGADWSVPVGTVMTKEPVTIAPDDNVATAIGKMSAGHYRRLPVVDADGKPQQFLKVSHILHYLVEHFPRYVYNLPPSPNKTISSREGA